MTSNPGSVSVVVMEVLFPWGMNEEIEVSHTLGVTEVSTGERCNDVHYLIK